MEKTQEKEIHEAIQRDSLLGQKLEKRNKGYNFINLKPEHRQYMIEVKVFVELDIKGRTESISVDHNLPCGYCGYGDDGLNAFLSDLKKWVATPYYIPRHTHRKNRVSSWDIKRSVECRRKTVRMSDVAVVVYDIAREYLKREHGIEDFAQVVRELLAGQREATKWEKRAVDRWVVLEERKLYLDKVVEPSGYSYSYREPRDKTQKFRISIEEHNKELKEIEKEMKKLSRKHKFLDIEPVSFDYLNENEDDDEEDFDDDEE